MVVGGIVLLYFGINYLKGLNLLQRRNVYFAVYADVSGINDASPVLYHGMKVGQVVRTEMLPDGTGRIAVAFQISEPRLVLPKDSRAEIYSSDLFTRAIQIVLGTSGVMSSAGDTLGGGAQLSLTESVNAQIDPLKKKAEGMLASVDSVLTAVQSILNINARKDIDASFNSLRGTMENVQGTTARINDMLDAESASIKGTLENLHKVSATFAAQSDAFTHIVNNADSITAALANGRLTKIMNDLTATSGQLRAIMQQVNEGQGTLGAMVKDDSLYHNLNSSARNLDLLLEDLRVNPNRYFSIFGKKDRLPKLSEADIERIQQAYQKQQGNKP